MLFFSPRTPKEQKIDFPQLCPDPWSPHHPYPRCSLCWLQGLHWFLEVRWIRCWKPRPDSSPPQIWKLWEANISYALHQRHATVCEGMQRLPLQLDMGRAFLALRVIDTCKAVQRVLNSWVLFWYYLLDYFNLSRVLNVKISNIADRILQLISNASGFFLFLKKKENNGTWSWWFLRIPQGLELRKGAPHSCFNSYGSSSTWDLYPWAWS